MNHLADLLARWDEEAMAAHARGDSVAAQAYWRCREDLARTATLTIGDDMHPDTSRDGYDLSPAHLAQAAAQGISEVTPTTDRDRLLVALTQAVLALAGETAIAAEATARMVR